MSYFLYGASVQGIQDFIFQTNKLKEIGGASELVEQICTSEFFKEAGIDANDENIIINAAGNIKYLFNDENKCQQLVRKFPRAIAEFAPGITISQAVFKLEKTGKLSDAINALEERLKAQRNNPQSPVEIGFMGLERARRTGGVGREYIENEVYDASSKKKIDAFAKYRKQSDSLNLKSSPNLYQKFFGADLEVNKIPFDVNQINKDSSSPWLAVIHADGNGLGKLVQRLSSKLKEKDTEVAKKAFAVFSRQLDEATQIAAKTAFKNLNLNASKEEKYPIRPILLGGDDITLIIRADLAFDFTVNFLQEFEYQTQKRLAFLSTDYEITEFRNGLTACAGIAYIKYSYPIHYGLHLAEELTKKAKKASKSIKDQKLPPSSISFYKVHSSFIEDIEEIEKKTLTAGNVRFDYGPYFLMRTSEFPEVKDLLKLLAVLDEHRNDKSKGVSKLRQWISELYKAESTADFMLKRIGVVDANFYKEMELDKAIVNNKTMIYDVLQLFSFL
ncbi:Cas10/Cmr2 second palm domain-containing protein [Emticicia fluvialis]|uniref:Cas10/Cmr2 second palm domain-containing protein n=1 Tax=Emticicia fluvialis TaxID=2974474 RepID=UPI002165FDB5|nr:hypothetical protein [Emticicia fluvialis]